MAERLVSNGTHLYKVGTGASAHLMRTPLTFTLSPDAMSFYAVAKAYTTSGWPARGFIDAATSANVKGVGSDCISQLVTPSDSRQMWRAVTTSHHPETVWYQGAYATSAPTASGAVTSCEAYAQLAAYHFTIPDLAGLAVTAAEIGYMNGGAIYCGGSAQSGAPANMPLISWSGWSGTFKMPIVPTASLDTFANLAAVASSRGTVVDVGTETKNAYDGGYAVNDCRQLWAQTVSYGDGYIPMLHNYPAQSVAASSGTLTYLTSNRSVWLVPLIDAGWQSSTSYKPFFWSSSAGTIWGCASMWDLTLKVTLSGANA